MDDVEDLKQMVSSIRKKDNKIKELTKKLETGVPTD